MVQKVMDNPTLFRHSKLKPSAQAVINHSYYLGQSLHMLSSSDEDSNFFRGVKLSRRDHTFSDTDDSSEDCLLADYDHDDASQPDIEFSDDYDLDDGLVLERVIYCDSGDESSLILTFSDNSCAAPEYVQYPSKCLTGIQNVSRNGREDL